MRVGARTGVGAEGDRGATKLLGEQVIHPASPTKLLKLTVKSNLTDCSVTFNKKFYPPDSGALPL